MLASERVGSRYSRGTISLADRVGARRLLLVGATAFAALSVLAATASSAETLILARALLGVAGSTLMPALFSLLRQMFRADAQRRLQGAPHGQPVEP